MNILFTTHQGNLAGSTLSLIYLVKGLAHRGHQIHVACKKAVLLEKSLTGYSNVTVHEIPFASYFDFRSCIKLKRVILSNKIQIVNAQGGRDRNLTILTKWIFGLEYKLIFTRRQRPRSEPLIKRWFHTNGTDKIIMISEGLKQIFLEKGYSEDHLLVIKNGIPSNLSEQVDPCKVEQLKKNLHLLDQPVVGCLSRKKSQEQVIEAFRFLPDHYIGLFVGIDEEEMGDLSDIKQRLIFTGQVEHHTALHYLKLMSVNVLPSYLDGFGLTLVESMQLGIPVIGSDFGGIPDIIQSGENGFLFENGNVNELAQKIVELIENADLREKFIAKGKEDSRSLFSIKRVVDEYETFFKSLVDDFPV
ncbi:MAG: glycosyltransferase family 4 protein [Marinoscillum sp.]